MDPPGKPGAIIARSRMASILNIGLPLPGTDWDRPPSTGRLTPVMSEASSEARNTAALTTSSGLPTLRTPQPERFQWMYTGKSVFLIGMLHGVGAETPSQLALFFLAANLGGTSRGMLGLAAFSIGLVAMNALMTASLGGAFKAGSTGHARFYQVIAWTGAAYSCVIGTIFLFGLSGKLPPLG